MQSDSKFCCVVPLTFFSFDLVSSSLESVLEVSPLASSFTFFLGDLGGLGVGDIFLFSVLAASLAAILSARFGGKVVGILFNAFLLGFSFSGREEVDSVEVFAASRNTT